MWNRGKVKPPALEDLGQDVWSPRGIKILGTPIGDADFVREHITKRLQCERELWETIPNVPDLQCAYQILVQSAGPRCNHLLRTVPPSQIKEYAEAHDAGMRGALSAILGCNIEEQEPARSIATLPARSGGLGVRSAARTSPAAFWASWADSLPMLEERSPAVVARPLQELEKGNSSENPLARELSTVTRKLRTDGFHCLPSWSELQSGMRPEVVGPIQSEAG